MMIWNQFESILRNFGFTHDSIILRVLGGDISTQSSS